MEIPRTSHPAEPLPFLHPKSFHDQDRKSRREIHTSSQLCNEPEDDREISQEEPAGESKAQNATPERSPKARGRMIRKVKASTEDTVGTAADTPRQNDSSTAPRTKRKSRPDLTGLAAKFKDMADKLRTQQRDEQERQPWISRDELPVSPLERAMKVQRRQPKRQPKTDEKQRLANNPWAVMLARPMRLEGASRTRLPTPLLVDFAHVKHPKDGQIYAMPNALADLENLKLRAGRGLRRHAMQLRAQEDMGQVMRLIPYKLGIEVLSDSFVVSDTQTKSTRTQKGAVMKRLHPVGWFEKSSKMTSYRVASKEYWELKEKQGELDDDLFKKPPREFEPERVQWQPDIAERLSDIMRQRVLIVLESLFWRQQRVIDSGRSFFTCLEWPDKLTLDPTIFQVAITERQDFWNDMGDIESPDAISGGGLRQGNQGDPRPPIAVQPGEISIKPPPNHFNKSDPRIWLPGSIVIHLGPPSSALQGLSQAKPGEAVKIDEEPIGGEYLPPMLTIGDLRLPVFNLQAMLGKSFHPVLKKLLQSHRPILSRNCIQSHPVVYQEGADMKFGLHETDYMIIVKSTAPNSLFVAQELWQLWRYLGGRDCLLEAVAGKQKLVRRPADDTSKESQRVARREKKIKGEYDGLSAKAWEHLHGLLGL
ncbi:hypothetical protein LTR64_005915 [Lithohypha guttulata]|uniref:Uncharacterized protein n=1 Tax=Lithohypha guttulata TaxID=1690604 RepID=A0AAN7YDK2_9EURO|nr:hypothetical protein LTR51_002288 [Lithohypha guttulata]KAK5089987.1 hypothetical protein LTR05_000156 [Lithohypha guttulata]